jgi:hypothetical protein
MSCILRISGTDFTVDEYLAKADWKAHEVRTHYKGDKRGLSNRFGVFEDSGFSMVASDAEFEDFEKQQKDVINFLKTYRHNFELLSGYNVDYWHCFDFGLGTYPSNRFSRTYILSAELLKLTSEFNLEIYMSNYFTNNARYLNKKSKKRWPLKK